MIIKLEDFLNENKLNENKLDDRYVDYSISRESWNDKTFNGYVDSPYWRVSFEFYEISLKDNGEYYIMRPKNQQTNSHIEEALNYIIDECKLNINLQSKI